MNSLILPLDIFINKIDKILRHFLLFGNIRVAVCIIVFKKMGKYFRIIKLGSCFPYIIRPGRTFPCSVHAS